MCDCVPFDISFHLFHEAEDDFSSHPKHACMDPVYIFFSSRKKSITDNKNKFFVFLSFGIPSVQAGFSFLYQNGEK